MISGVLTRAGCEWRASRKQPFPKVYLLKGAVGFRLIEREHYRLIRRRPLGTEKPKTDLLPGTLDSSFSRY